MWVVLVCLASRMAFWCSTVCIASCWHHEGGIFWTLIYIQVFDLSRPYVRPRPEFRLLLHRFSQAKHVCLGLKSGLLLYNYVLEHLHVHSLLWGGGGGGQ